MKTRLQVMAKEVEETEKSKSLASFWSDFLQEEFNKETDRGAVVLTVSLFDNALTNLLKKHLAPVSASEDELFDGPTAPISTFSAKVQLSQRLGLISTRLARDLNLVRKMRNEFAHNVHGSSLDSGKIKDYLTTLIASSRIAERHGKYRKNFPAGVRGDFLATVGAILFRVQTLVESPLQAQPILPMEDEWVYTFDFSEEKEEDKTPEEE